MNKNLCAILLSLFTFVLLSGCSGGGNSDSGNGSSDSLSGTAALGHPISGATISLICASGNALTTTTDSSGDWSLTLSEQTLPCAVEVSGGTANGNANSITFHSIAIAAGTVNVTPITDLLVAHISGSPTPDIWFAGLSSLPASLTSITQTEIDAALSQLSSALSALPALATTNPITTSFNAIAGNINDDMLSALNAALIDASLSYSSLLDSAAASTVSAPAGFNTALAAAYANTSSGNSGSGGSISCTAAHYSVAVHQPSSTELATYAKTYSGNTGDFGPNPGDPFVVSGSATFVLSSAGELTYNNTNQTITSMCLEDTPTTGAPLYVEFGTMDAVDFFNDGGFSGSIQNSANVNGFDIVQGGSCSTICGVGSNSGTTATISGISPSTGPAGTAVYINGSNLNSFTPSPKVTFDTTEAAVTSYSYLGGVQITVNVPAGLSAGSYTITVSNGDGTGVVSAGTFIVTN